jgi:hypothetical protein
MRPCFTSFTAASDEELNAIEASHRDVLKRAQATKTDARLLDDAQAIDWGLHDRMVDALGNEIISDIYRVNSLRVRLIKLEHSVITPARLIPAMQEHLNFIAALQASVTSPRQPNCWTITSTARAAACCPHRWSRCALNGLNLHHPPRSGVPPHPKGDLFESRYPRACGPRC